MNTGDRVDADQPSATSQGRAWPAIVSSLRLRTAVALLASTAVLGLWPGSARAAKWSDCPTQPLPVHRSSLGATNAPFVHPGHELRIVLNAAQVAASGGFSVAPSGNAIHISFASLFGEPIVLAPRQVAAITPAILSFDFPDTAAETGRVLTGPVAIRVTRGDALAAQIDAADLVALPPASDVTSLVLGGDPHQTIHAALGADGDLWVPASFHGDPMAMPGCEGNFIIPVPIEIGAATIPGLSSRGVEPLHRIRRVTLYLGDLDINGASFYGMLFPKRISLVHVGGTRGVAICRVNDAVDVVLRVKGSRAWARARKSPMRTVVQDAAPIPLVLRGALSLPAKAAAVKWDGDVDSFGNGCDPTPPSVPGAPSK